MSGLSLPRQLPRAVGRLRRPAVSVVVPARDAAPYLGAALSSLTRQGIASRRLEVIVVDDGSLDETAQIAESFAPRLPGLRILRHDEPVGLAASRNHALAEARGEHLAFLDADDWLWPGTLAAARATRQRLDVDFVVFDQVQVTGFARTPRRAPEHRREVALDPRAAILPTGRTTMVNYPNACVRLAHRRLLDDGLLDFDPALRTAEDRSWAWRLHLRATSFAVSSEGRYGYRRDVPGSLTNVSDERQLDVLAAYASIAAMLDDDAEGARLLPKAVRDLFVVLVHHLGPDGPLTGELRTRLATGANGLLSTLDADVVARQLATLGDERAQVLRSAGVRSAGLRDEELYSAGPAA